MKPGDIIKFKWRGMTTRFMFLHPEDQITSDCVFQPVDTNAQEDTPYSDLLQKFNPKNHIYYSTQAGDQVKQHPGRVYLVQLTNLEKPHENR